MGEGALFAGLAIVSTVSAGAILFLRRPLAMALAALINVFTITAIFFALQAPLVAMVQFAIMLLLFAGTLQFIRSVGPTRLYVRRRLSFMQLVGLASSFLLGTFVLLHLTSLTHPVLDVGSASILYVAISPQIWSLLGLAALLIFAALIAVRILSRSDSTGDPA